MHKTEWTIFFLTSRSDSETSRKNKKRQSKENSSTGEILIFQQQQHKEMIKKIFAKKQ
ncbi:hypothetical protein DOY81_004078 [Sarcophaga bullata]|nr:hypothetical protein DOY81_004078 [Sarcophaga bullata]